MCMALKEADQIGSYDFAQMSLRRAADNLLFSKDGFYTDSDVTKIKCWCGKKWFDPSSEPDVDWILDPPNQKGYDKNSNSFLATFNRSLTGSSINDYTLKLDTPYEVRLSYGIFDDEK